MFPARGVGWEPSGPYRRAAAASVAVALLLCLGLAAAELYVGGGSWGFPLDDSWIHLVFARSLAAGEGLAFNSGELVSGSTAPLWTALLSLAFVAPGDPVLWTKLLGVLFHVVTVCGTARLAHRLGLASWSSLLAASLTAASGWLVWSSLSGLEIPLFLALATWGMVLQVEERRHPDALPRSLALFGAGALARPEGLLLLALAVVDRSLVARRGEDGRLIWGRGTARAPSNAPMTALGLGAALVLVAPVVLFNARVGGSLLPATYLAKASGAHSVIPEAAYLHAILGIFFQAFPLLVLLAGTGTVELGGRLGTARDGGLLPALWLFGLPIAYGALSPPDGPYLAGNFGRYLFPAFPPLLLLGALGLERLAGVFTSVGSAKPFGRWVGGGLLAALVLWPAGAGTARGAGRYLQSVGNVRDGDERIAGWLAERLPVESVLAVNDIGAIKYRLPEHRIRDLAGIVDPEIVAYRKQAIAEGRSRGEGDRRFLSESRPDYLVIFPGWFPELAADGASFPEVHRIVIPDNITMGDNYIVVLQTPWTRTFLDPSQGAVR